LADPIPPLHQAAREGRVDDLVALLDAGADLEATDRYGRTALDFAIELCFDPAPTRLLLARGANVGDVERALRNAFSDETRSLLADHFGVPLPAPPPAPRPVEPPTEAEWEALLPRLREVMVSLEDDRVFARLDAGFTQQMAFLNVHQSARALPSEAFLALRGFAFTTRQDMERARREGRLPVGFGAPTGGDAAAVEVGRAVVAAFERAGFEVTWDGSASARPMVWVLSGLG
jgi:hypothetical protein